MGNLRRGGILGKWRFVGKPKGRGRGRGSAGLIRIDQIGLTHNISALIVIFSKLGSLPPSAAGP